MKFFQLEKHMKNCSAVEHVACADWAHPWGVVEQVYLSGGKNNPRHKGYEHWFVVGCNSTQCPAKMAVRFDDVMKLAPTGESRKRIDWSGR